MFVWGLSKLVCEQTLGFDIHHRLLVHKDNPDTVGRFSDTGFKGEFREEGSNQVSHFVAYIQAAYYGGQTLASLHLAHRERFNFFGADYKLGARGIFVGMQLRINQLMGWAVDVGYEPTSVGWFIRNALADSSWRPPVPEDPNDANDPPNL